MYFWLSNSKGDAVAMACWHPPQCATVTKTILRWHDHPPPKVASAGLRKIPRYNEADHCVVTTFQRDYIVARSPASSWPNKTSRMEYKRPCNHSAWHQLDDCRIQPTNAILTAAVVAVRGGSKRSKLSRAELCSKWLQAFWKLTEHTPVDFEAFHPRMGVKFDV